VRKNYQQRVKARRNNFDYDIFSPQNYETYDLYIKAMIDHFKLNNPSPHISASSYILTNLDTNETLFAKKDQYVRQVASLTKIMTFWAVL